MNCQVPHERWCPPLSHRDFSLTLQKRCEDKFAPDGRLVCPRVGFRSDGSLGVIKPQGNTNKPLLLDYNEHTTLPLPIFPPSPIPCGTDLPSEFSGKPHELDVMLCEESLANECRLLLATYRNVSLQSIKAAWKNYMDGADLPSDLQSLKAVVNRYGYYQDPPASYDGGNIESIRLSDDERYLIHSVTEPDCALCFTRMSTVDVQNAPMKIDLKLPLDDGKLYQIAKPKTTEISHATGEIGTVFATRQLHTTRVWKAKPNENGINQPTISPVQEFCDPKSTVRFIDFNRYIWGELGELRSNKLIISRTGSLLYMSKLNKEYDSCMYLNHPKTLVLSKKKGIDLLDTRCSQKENLMSVFSLENPELTTYYNFPPNQTIVCFYPSSRDHICYVGTESCFLVWDIRHGNRPLSKMHHYMKSPPAWITSLQVGADTEWLFLDSQDPGYSCMLGITWGSQRLCLDESITDSFPVPIIEIEPIDRLTVLNTLTAVRSKAVGLEDCVYNRFKQARTGVTCDRDSDGSVQIWQSNVVGDVYVQKFNLNEKIEFSQQRSIENVFPWLSEWVNDVEKIESVRTLPLPGEQDTNIDVLDDFLSWFGECCNREAMPDDSWYNPGLESITPAEVEDNLNVHERIRHTNRFSGLEDSQPSFLGREETFSCDFDDDLISSTPLDAASKRKALSGFELETPAVRKVRSNFFSTPKPVITSTPLNPNSLPFGSSSFKTPKSNTRSRRWDDF